jgi:hypothetical protein
MQYSLFMGRGQHFQLQPPLASSQTAGQGRELHVWEDVSY